MADQKRRTLGEAEIERLRALLPKTFGAERDKVEKLLTMMLNLQKPPVDPVPNPKFGLN